MNYLKDFFYYTRTERNGIIVLLGLLFVVFVLPYTFSVFGKEQKIDFETWEKDVQAFEDGLSEQKIAAKQIQKQKRVKWNMNATRGDKRPVTKLNPIKFDPNTVTPMDLEAMNLPERTIKSILNYRAKGGKFRTREALKKIYTLSNEHYKQLYPFIQLKSEKNLSEEEQEIVAKESLPLPPAFAFDPNTATVENLEALGLASNTIRSIVNYRNKGGVFKKKEDFKKIYTLPDSVYQHLFEHIQITEQPTYTAKSAYQPKSYQKIDINSATAEDFQQFKGIGPSYAKRILKMKEGLGGFISVQQIGELYKLPDSTFQLMLPYLECAPTTVQQLNVNTATLDELKAHPYLRWFHAKAIIHYRETEGKWKSIDLLQILTEFDDGKGTFEKVKPYLRVD